jgi:hypothetical protein
LTNCIILSIQNGGDPSAKQPLSSVAEAGKHYGTSRASLEDDAEAMLIAGGSVSGDSAMEGESSAPCCSIQGCASQAIRVVTVPIEALLSITIPPLCHGEGEPDVSKVWPQTLVVSLVYVALLSWAVLELTTGVADMIGMPHHIAGKKRFFFFFLPHPNTPCEMSLLLIVRVGQHD